MIPASATARSASAITRSDGSSSRVDAVERPQLLPARRPADDDLAAGERVQSNAWSGLPSASMT